MISYPVSRPGETYLDALTTTEWDALVDLLIEDAVYQEGRWHEFRRRQEYYWPGDRALLRELVNRASPREKETAFRQAGYLTGLFW